MQFGRLIAFLLGALAAPCRAHGKLTVPMPRDGKAGRAGLDENNPVPLASDDFVCRYPKENPQVERTSVIAGGTLNMQWFFAAKHVGDCAAYVSYDVDLPRRSQRFVKIANFPECKDTLSVTIDVPSILPPGHAILRWDWAALHTFPKIEWFSSCADIVVQSSSAASPSQFDCFSIIDPPVYPVDGSAGVGFRQPWNAGSRDIGDEGWYMTGPACLDETLNHCELTAPGTPGYTGFGGGVGQSPPAPTFAPVPLPPSPTLAPSPARSCEPIGDCGETEWCDQDLYVVWCSSRGAEGHCPQPFCKNVQGSDLAPTLAPTVLPPSAPTSAPSPSQEGCPNGSNSQCGGAGFQGDTCCPVGHYCKAVGEYWSQCYSCQYFPDRACSDSLLSRGTKARRAERHKFLSVALIQEHAVLERAPAGKEL